MNTQRALASVFAILICVAGCGRKEEPRADAKITEVVCSYAPSKSKAVLAFSSAAGGVGAGASAVASTAGLSVVAHSSGAYIFTGTAGYVAGTLGTAVLFPVAVTVGALAGGAAATVELVCAPKNHPELVAKVNALAEEFARKIK